MTERISTIRPLFAGDERVTYINLDKEVFDEKGTVITTLGHCQWLLLHAFLSCDGQALSWSELADHIWQPDERPPDPKSTLRLQVFMLKEKLDLMMGGLSERIVTVRGYGYRWENSTIGHNTEL